ncbi:hypothetical protein [Aestuariimicrobium ganziense]|uniref:hypothetical protein n=1 Tax=Aestuariimicrobium ganziense TaxID=2773677 RepID=UPI001941011C|nr:hypothetical protein [Aestuariimicrobium ganziense]
MTTWLIWILIGAAAMIGLLAMFALVLVVWQSRSTSFDHARPLRSPARAPHDEE